MYCKSFLLGCFRSNLRGGGFEGVSPQEVFRQQKDHVRLGPRGQKLRQAEGGGRVDETIRVPQTKRRTRTNDRGRQVTQEQKLTRFVLPTLKGFFFWGRIFTII